MGGWTALICPSGTQLPPQHWQDLQGFSLEWPMMGEVSLPLEGPGTGLNVPAELHWDQCSFSQTHEDILEGIFCEVRVSSWFTFGETGHLCTRPCSKQSSLAMGEKQHFNLTSTLATLPVPPASEEGKVCLPTEEKIQN